MINEIFDAQPHLQNFQSRDIFNIHPFTALQILTTSSTPHLSPVTKRASETHRFATEHVTVRAVRGNGLERDCQVGVGELRKPSDLCGERCWHFVEATLRTHKKISIVH